MKTLKIFLTLILLILGCKENVSVDDTDLSNNPPVQKGEIDLVGFFNEDVMSISVNPLLPSHILVSTKNPRRGVYLSQDYGRSWNLVFDNSLVLSSCWGRIKSNEVFISKNEGMDIYPKLLKSEDFGKSWARSDSNIRIFDSHITRIETDYFNENNVYLIATAHPYGMPSDAPGIIFASTNGGKIFSKNVNNSLNNYVYADFTDISINNTIPNLIYVGLSDLYQTKTQIAISSNGGISWHIKNIDNEFNACTKILSKNNLIVVLAGKSGHVTLDKYWKYTVKNVNIYISEDYGNTFKKIEGKNIGIYQCNDIILTPEGYIILSGIQLQDNSKTAIYISKDKGSTWQTLGKDFESKTLLAYDSKNKFLYFVKDDVNKGLYRMKLN
ncbi:MAG: hypothetical protein N2043_04430 [Ignavibacterium sp.]|nr:hypothetical protein [Ignavibacterium sp.]